MKEIRESTRWEGRSLTVTWQRAPFLPPRDLVTQVSGVCFTSDGQIVLVSSDGSNWSLPGGHLEPGETLEEALAREAWEEACARISHLTYLGTQEVVDLESPAPPYRYYQGRFWARVSLEPFEPRFETRHRRLVAPQSFVAMLNWDTAAIAQEILSAALDAENRFGGAQPR